MQSGLTRNRRQAMIPAYADDVSIFVTCRSDIEVVEKVLDRCEKVTRAKINCTKSSGLGLGAWKTVALLESVRWTDWPVRILGVGFATGIQLKKNYSEV